MINDYVEAKGGYEFDVINRDVRYTFKVNKKDNVNQVVNNLNNIIKKHYDLD